MICNVRHQKAFIIADLCSTSMSASDLRCANHLRTSDSAICDHPSHCSVVLEQFSAQELDERMNEMKILFEGQGSAKASSATEVPSPKNQQGHNGNSKPKPSTTNCQNGQIPEACANESIMGRNVETVESIVFGSAPIV